MPPRPLVVAFDIIETTISLEPLRPSFLEAGLPRDRVLRVSRPSFDKRGGGASHHEGKIRRAPETQSSLAFNKQVSAVRCALMRVGGRMAHRRAGMAVK